MKSIFVLFFLMLSLQLKGEDIDSWSSPPDIISTTGVNASDPRIGMDASGNVVAVWVENGVVQANTKLAGSSWNAITSISNSGASSPRVAVDSSGNATAIWVESGVIKAATLPFGMSWSSASSLSGSGSSSPQIGVKSGSGDVAAIWITNGVIQSATKLFGQSWPVTPDTLSATGSDSPQIAIGNNGTAVAIWHTVDAVTTMDVVYTNVKSIGGSWGTSQNVSDLNQNGVFPKIAVDPNGNAIATWYRYDVSGVNYSNVILQASLLPSSNTGWSTPVDVSSPGVRNPAELVSTIGFTGSGNAIAAWTTSFDIQHFNIESSVLDVNGSWSSPVDLAIDLYAYAVDIAVTPVGDAYAVYMIFDPPSSSVVIQTAESDVGSRSEENWNGVTNLTTGVGNNAPRIAAAVTGSINNIATAVWVSFDGTNTVINSSTGTGTLLLPPSSPMVVQNFNDYGVLKEYYNTISWQASTDTRVTGYLIYRNGTFVDGVDSFTLQYVDHNAEQNGAVTYGIASNDNGDSRSNVITVSFP